jgi:hypothetical protein
VRKDEIDRYILKRPFEPIEIRLVDGQKFRFRSPEQFLVGRSMLVTMDKKALPLFISMDLIATIRHLSRNGNKRG